jgi:APA family basic amino acid/polyamine antiporter
VISLIFYCLVLIAVSMVLPRNQLLGVDLPVAQAFRIAFHSSAIAKIILVAGLLGLVAVWNALFFAATRVIYVLGRSRLLDPRLGELDPVSGSPHRAVVLVTGLSIVGLFLGKGVLLPVVNVTSTLFALMYAVVSFGTWRHRRLQTAASSGYRVPGGRWLVGLAAAFSVYLVFLSLVQQRMEAGGWLPTEWLVMFVIGAIAWWFWARSKNLRNAIGPEERRRIILEQDGQPPGSNRAP